MCFIIPLSQVHFFNSFFHKQLVAKGYDGVKRWTKKVRRKLEHFGVLPFFSYFDSIANSWTVITLLYLAFLWGPTVDLQTTYSMCHVKCVSVNYYFQPAVQVKVKGQNISSECRNAHKPVCLLVGDFWKVLSHIKQLFLENRIWILYTPMDYGLLCITCCRHLQHFIF